MRLLHRRARRWNAQPRSSSGPARPDFFTAEHTAVEGEHHPARRGRTSPPPSTRRWKAQHRPTPPPPSTRRWKAQHRPVARGGAHAIHHHDFLRPLAIAGHGGARTFAIWCLHNASCLDHTPDGRPEEDQLLPRCRRNGQQHMCHIRLYGAFTEEQAPSLRAFISLHTPCRPALAV